MVDMTLLEPLLQRARATKAQLKLWNAELDRLRYPDYYRGRLTPDEANLLLYNHLRQGLPLMAGKLGAGCPAWLITTLISPFALPVKVAAVVKPAGAKKVIASGMPLPLPSAGLKARQL